MKLHVVHAPRKPTLAQIKQAVALFRSEFAPRELRRANARKWLLQMEQLGDRYVYRGGKVSWSYNSRSAK